MSEIFVCNSPKIEIRGANNEPRSLSGYAAIFNSLTDIGCFQEQIAEGAFDEALADPNLDVVARFDHDGQPLGRTANGTLKLTVDNHGLRYDVTPPDTSLGRDILALVKRGDVSSSSFAFSLRSNGDTWDYSGKVPIRTLRNINLHDVSPVTTPAYASTSVQARSKNIPIKVEGKPELSVEYYERAIRDANLRNADIRLLRFGK